MVESQVMPVAPLLGVVGDTAAQQTVRGENALAGIREPHGGKAIRVSYPWVERRHHIDQTSECPTVQFAPTAILTHELHREQPVVIG